MIRVAGYRTDGAVWLMLDGGLSCILLGDRSSPAVDERAVEALGPWDDATGVDGVQRQELQRRLRLSLGAPLAHFALGEEAQKAMRRKKFKFEYETFDEGPPKAEQVVGDVPDENPDDDIVEDDDEDMPAPGGKRHKAKGKKKAPAVEAPVELADWDESAHPRGPDGKFGEGGGGGEGGGKGGGETRSASQIRSDIASKERALKDAREEYASAVNVSANAPGGSEKGVQSARDSKVQDTASRVRDLDREVKEAKENFAPRESQGEKKDAEARSRWEQQRQGPGSSSKAAAQMVDYNVTAYNEYKGGGPSGLDPHEFTPTEGNRTYDGQGNPADGERIRDGLRDKGWKERPSARGVILTHPDGQAQVRFEAHGNTKERTFFEPAGTKGNLKK